MTRIRYKNMNGTLVTKWFKTPNGNEIGVNIKPDFTFVICDLKGDLTLNSDGTVKTLAEAKKRAKQALESLGIVFQAEVRPRTTTKAEKEEVLKLYQKSIMEDNQ